MVQPNQLAADRHLVPLSLAEPVIEVTVDEVGAEAVVVVALAWDEDLGPGVDEGRNGWTTWAGGAADDCSD